MTDLINKEGLKLPLVALRDMVVFPRVSTSLDAVSYTHLFFKDGRNNRVIVHRNCLL